MSDDRPVHTDALKTLGTIIGDAEARDAIHLAVEPVVADEMLSPGQHVGLLPSGRASSKAKPHLGIVDPFLGGTISAETRFWLIVYPRQITSLRHVWEHPDFPTPFDHPVSSKTYSEQWLRDYVVESPFKNYETLMEVLTTGEARIRDENDDHDDYLGIRLNDWGITTIGTDDGGSIPRQFWDHAEVVTGKRFPNRHEYFSCSC